jgi:hypothetical protein
VFVLDQNFLLWICVAIVGGIIGFVIYGCIKGFENIFREKEPDDSQMKN